MIEWVEDEDEQVHVALLALSESESFNLVLGTAPLSLEALGRRVRRNGGKRRTLYCDKSWIRCDWKTFPQGRFERSKSSGATTTVLDDIKTFALDVLVRRSEWEQHLAVNRARLIAFEQG